MDPSVLLMLSNLLHLQNHLDPTSSLLSDTTASTSSSSVAAANPALSSSSAAPLLFFAIASVLSYASSARQQQQQRRSPSPSPPPSSSSAAAFFRPLSSDRIWSVDPAARDARWRSLYGVSYQVFATLLDHLRPHGPIPNLPLPPDRSLALALARLSRGIPSPALARSLSLPPSLVSRSTNALTRLLSTKLYPDFVKPPVSHRLLSTLSSFHDVSLLPNVAGAVASSPVRIRSHDHDPSLRSPNRSFPAVLLQAVADTRRVFWDACVRHPGSSDPASHLRDSALYHRLSSSRILRDSVLTVRGHHVRPYLVGDPSYPLLPFLLTPFGPPSAPASPPHEAFDAALAKARTASVDPALALLKGRWRILRNLNVGLDHAAQTVVACVVLHNVCQIAREPEDEARCMWRDPPESPQLARPVDTERSMYYFGESLRQALADDLYERLSGTAR